VNEAIRKVIEQAWFEHRSLVIRYQAARGEVSTRTIRIDAVIMERSLTLLNCFDLDKKEERQFRMDRIEMARLATLNP
jgi:predicted DNA-binding transcriptional regulator YafY